jgi:phosphopentomutase
MAGVNSLSADQASEKLTRAIVLVVDGCGVGAAPDAAQFGDSDNCNTLANVAYRSGPLSLPNLAQMGLGNIIDIDGVPKATSPQGLYGKLCEVSNGKDTQTGHWEMMGVISPSAFPTYPEGFPPEIIERFISETGCRGVLCNKPASGTDILNQLGEQHQKTGFPIVYTSADSVFQIACHVETVPLTTLYRWCEVARAILQGAHRVGRVIARPFTGAPGAYIRLQGERRDYAVPPPAETLLDDLKEHGLGVFGIGKIDDIFTGQGITHAKHTGTNREGLELTLKSIKGEISLPVLKRTSQAPDNARLIFTNLVDTDSLYGHRRDASGYAKALLEIDSYLGRIMQAMSEQDLLIISSDHGNDPTMPGTDHTREYVPLLIYSPRFVRNGDPALSIERNLGTRQGFADIAATVADWLKVGWSGPGVSCLGAQ